MPQYIKPKAYEPGSITNIYFTGINSATNFGRGGEGGYFHFFVENATSYELKLDFENMTAAKRDDEGNYVLDDDGNKIFEGDIIKNGRSDYIVKFDKGCWVAEDKNSLGFVTERFDYTLNSWISSTKPSIIC